MSHKQLAHPKRGILTTLLVTAVPTLTLFLFVPFVVFGSNRTEFDSGFLDLLPTLLLPACLLWAVLVLIGLTLKTVARDRYLWLIFALGALVWAQSTFLTHDYGVLDGRGLAWRAVGGFARLDLLLWITLPIVLLWHAKRVQSLLMPMAISIIALQMVGGLEVIRSHEVSPWRADQIEHGQIEHGQPPEELFHYSTERNIVHIVLDNFQSDVFEELVAEEGMESTFDGFVQYTDNAAAAPYTNLAIPSILLGRTFDGTIPDSDFHKEAAENGIPSRLHDMGYQVNLSLMRSLQGTRHSAVFQIPDTMEASPITRARTEALDLLDITLFRAAPHRARPWVYNENNWRIRRLIDRGEILPKAFAHREFLHQYAKRIQTTGSDPAYHFVHVWPPHPPYVTNLDGTPAGKVLPNTRENYRHEARATLHAVASIFNALKEQGLYDNSFIVLQSDHGGSFEPDFTPKRMFALLAVKPRASRGELRYSSAQTSVTDVAATIMHEEEPSIAWPGSSIFTISESESRTRHYAMYHGDDNDTLRMIRISGPLGSPESYEYLDPQELAVHRPLYRYGTTAYVGLEGEATGYLGSGWSSPSPRFVWNNGQEATLEIPINPSNKSLELSLWLLPGIYDDDWPRQRIILIVGGREIERWELAERQTTELMASIPAEFTNTEELVLHFHFPDAVRQTDIGVGHDGRLKSIALSRFRLSENPGVPD